MLTAPWLEPLFPYQQLLDLYSKQAAVERYSFVYSLNSFRGYALRCFIITRLAGRTLNGLLTLQNRPSQQWSYSEKSNQIIKVRRYKMYIPPLGLHISLHVTLPIPVRYEICNNFTYFRALKFNCHQFAYAKLVASIVTNSRISGLCIYDTLIISSSICMSLHTETFARSGSVYQI